MNVVTRQEIRKTLDSPCNLEKVYAEQKHPMCKKSEAKLEALVSYLKHTFDKKV